MKNLILISLMMFSGLAQAEITDFNALIQESAASQKKLSRELEDQLEIRRNAFKNPETPVYIVDQRSGSVNVPSNKKLLRFQKEVVNHSAHKNIQDKVAQELNSAEMQF